jgi:endonuclease YncB( thermonuclease family)
MIARRTVLGGLLASCLPSPAFAATYRAKVLSVHDGDTFRIDRLIFGMAISVRIRGIDTGETYPNLAKCPEELAAGLAAKAFLIELLQRGGNEVTLRRPGKDAYNSRYLFDVSVNIGGKAVDVATEMIRAGHAKRYEPVKDKSFAKPDWCPAGA